MSVLPLDRSLSPHEKPDHENLWKRVALLAAPVVVEQLLHSIVQFTDTYIANNLIESGAEGAIETNRQAATAIGTVAYLIWFFGLIAGTIGVGATALIARAVGAKHRRVASAVCGQAMLAALGLGILLGLLMWFGAGPIGTVSGLPQGAVGNFTTYMRILAPALPLTIVMFAAASCLRGSGDTISAAVAFIILDLVNALLSLGLTRGWGPLPHLGFAGIAVGTAIAYSVGALLMLGVLFSGRSKVRLYRHRLIPHWLTMKRMLRIGLPAGAEQTLQWIANFAIVRWINEMGALSAAAHLNVIRIEAFSFLMGMGFAVAASTLVGQSLGMKDIARARKCGFIAFALGGGLMAVMGLLFIVLGPQLVGLITDDDEMARLAGRCMRITGCTQLAFGASMIFGASLRGAGETFSVMAINLCSIIGVRLIAVIIAIEHFDAGLEVVWIIFAVELILRGTLLFRQFKKGRWATIRI